MSPTAEELIDNPDLLTVNILRLWDREKIERFALHLLGSEHPLALVRSCAVTLAQKGDEVIIMTSSPEDAAKLYDWLESLGGS